MTPKTSYTISETDAAAVRGILAEFTITNNPNDTVCSGIIQNYICWVLDFDGDTAMNFNRAFLKHIVQHNDEFRNVRFNRKACSCGVWTGIRQPPGFQLSADDEGIRKMQFIFKTRRLLEKMNKDFGENGVRLDNDGFVCINCPANPMTINENLYDLLYKDGCECNLTQGQILYSKLVKP